MNYLLSILFLFSVNISAQDISKQVIGASGQTSTAGNNTMSFTLGETIVAPMYNEETLVQLGNGYYPSFDLSVLSTESEEINLQMKVFPNPVVESLFITHPVEDNFNIQIIDITGKVILSKMHNKNSAIPMNNYSSGTYFIKVTTKQTNQTNTYKIIKK
jgi:hypothetical protein